MDVQYIGCSTPSVFFKDCNFGQLKHTQYSNEYEVNEATGRKEIDVVVDAVGSDEIIPIGFDMICYRRGIHFCWLGWNANQNTFIPTLTKRMSISWFVMG